jgi:hypothetical protein
MKPLPALLLSCTWFVSYNASPVHAQSGPEKGGHDMELWSGGGNALNHSSVPTGIWTAGVRYGWVLTDPHGRGFVRGRLEYAVEVAPIFWVFQPQGTAYGAGVQPVVLKWNFDSHRRVVPYSELGSGVLFTDKQVPLGASKLNFTSGGAFGVHVLGNRLNWSAEVRFMHISNSGISSVNPGINTLQVRLGIGVFRHRSR